MAEAGFGAITAIDLNSCKIFLIQLLSKSLSPPSFFLSLLPSGGAHNSFHPHFCSHLSIPGLPRWQVIKNLSATAGDAGDIGSVPALQRSPGEGNGNPLQYSCLGSPMNRGARWATVLGVLKVRHDLVTKQPPPPFLILLIPSFSFVLPSKISFLQPEASFGFCVCNADVRKEFLQLSFYLRTSFFFNCLFCFVVW